MRPILPIAVLAITSVLTLQVPQTAYCSDAVADVVTAVSENYALFKNIHYLTIDFDLKYEQISGMRNYIFDHATVKTARKGPKQRLDLDADVFNGTRMQRSYTWDGKVAKGLHVTGSNMGEYFMSPTKNNNLLYYNYYIDLLLYPDATGSAQSPGGPADGSYLPRILRQYPPSGSPRPDDVDGAACVLLERLNHYKFWFDPALAYALRRSELSDTKSGNLQERTVLSQFQEVAGVWLPMIVAREEYATRRQQGDIKPGTLLARKTIQVVKLSSTDIPDSTFHIPSPPNTRVHDNIRKTFYTHYSDDKNLVVESAERVRHLAKQSNKTWWLSVVAILLTIATIFLYFLLRYLGGPMGNRIRSR